MCAVIIPVACICPDIDGAHIQMELSGVEEISAILICFQLQQMSFQDVYYLRIFLYKYGQPIQKHNTKNYQDLRIT